jgi:uncharacterized protein YbjT (DUF2867 family)
MVPIMRRGLRILVTGATGQIGSALVHHLASHSSQPQIRAATRDVSSRAASLLHAFNPHTVHPVHLDVDAPAALRAALDGVTTLCIIAPLGNDMATWHHKLMDAVVQAGTCEYVVKVSVTGARSPDSDPPPGRLPLAHWQGEAAIRERGVSATMIRPTIFMQHFLTVPGLYTRGDGRMYLPTGDGRIAFLDCRDIARFAAALATLPPEERHPFTNQAYELTGPEALMASEIATILSWAADRRITHIDGEDAFVERCRTLGVADGIKAIYHEAATGWFSEVAYAAFEQCTKHRPTSFAKFAYDYAHYFRPD